ncbi:GNAT family N-acetyltransferase [Candidatus Poribacteria bacterium]|nr:GNAT family N-acetyltransferase [Candidatus Poribacteria bacterium]
MRERLTLYTARLKLRPFSLDDAPIVQVLAGHPDIARTTLAIPHPYPDGAAEAWIASHAVLFEQGTAVHFAIERPSDGTLIGAIGLRLEREHARAELEYWIGKPYWGQGYCTEAAQAVVQYGFVSLGLHRIYAYHFTINPASGRVLQKIGMQYEGRRRQHTVKDDVFLDSDAYGILRNEYGGI